MLKKIPSIETFDCFRVSAMWLIISSALLGSFGCSRMSSQEAKQSENNPDTAAVVLNQPFQRGAYFNKGWEGGIPQCMGQ